MLRPYQIDAVNSLFDYFESKDGNPVIALPTGCGKTHIISGFTHRTLTTWPHQKIIVLTHVKELIKQNYNKLIAAWPEAPAGIYSAGLRQRDIHNSIIFGGIGSVAKKAEQFGYVNLVIIDEAHLLSPSENTMYQRFINALKKVNSSLKVIGLTATPWRMKQGKIIDEGLFTDICFDMTDIKGFNKLINDKYILPLIPKKTHTQLDTSGVSIRGNEFVQKELQQAVDQYKITLAALKEALEIAHDRKRWLIFASGIEHAVHIKEILNNLNTQYKTGIACEVVHGGNKQYPMSSNERDRILADHKNNKFRAIANNNILTTGYDDPEIDLIMTLRPTRSPGLWMQKLGRGTRPNYAPGFDLSTMEGRAAAIEASPKQNCLVLDFAGNTARLGPINDPVLPSKRRKKGNGTAPVKICDNCQTYNHATAKRCIACDYEFHKKTELKAHASTQQLIRDDTPKIEQFNVETVTYHKHNKKDRPPSLRVSYFCGLKKFQEFVCFEHTGYAKQKAIKWWRKRTNTPVPDTVQVALTAVNQIAVPSRIKVHVNTKYPEILEYEF